MKRKIGTVLENELFIELKTKAARENRSISDLIQDALGKYLREDYRVTDQQRAMDRLLNPPLKLSRAEWRAIMDEDFYDQ